LDRNRPVRIQTPLGLVQLLGVFFQSAVGTTNAEDTLAGFKRAMTSTGKSLGRMGLTAMVQGHQRDACVEALRSNTDNWLSIILVKSATDCGPLKNSPLIKKVGVALTPAWEPA